MKMPFLIQKQIPAAPPKSFKVFATLCVHRTLDPEAFGSLLNLLMCPNPKVSLSRRRGDALIDRARSMEASRFLKSDCDVCFFVDDDIIFDAKDAVSVCREAYERKTIVGAAYTLKQEGGGQFTTKLLKEQKSLPFGIAGGIHQVRMLATGFMAIHRQVLEDMAKTMPSCVSGEGNFYPFFQPFPQEIDGKFFYLSEDWAMNFRAEKLGYKIYCDTRIKLLHAGRKIYSWDDFQHGKPESIESFEYNENIAG